MNFDCISAISTAPVASGVGVIRISGDGAFAVAENMFKCKTPVSKFEPYKLYVGSIDGGNITDFGMCVIFKAPKSYTGEDMVEFHCHGGVAITRAVLKRTFDFGARLAERGEFTKRAFLNGKMSLSSCEGLVDMIYAQSDSEAKTGFYLYREKLLKKIQAVQDKLKYVLALIDANIDYPEEDLEFTYTEQIKQTLSNLRADLVPLVDSYRSASKMAYGVNVAICGRPNAGKSSLLNAILGEDKAIVTDVKGTTRDVVEGWIEYGGVRFNFFDTAGIRESADKVEMIGIERSKKTISSADFVLYLIDGAEGVCDEDRKILSTLDNDKTIIIVNKCDLMNGSAIDDGRLYVSALEGTNVKELLDKLLSLTALDEFNFEGDFLTEERHYLAINNAISSLNKALSSIDALPLDVIASDIKDAWRYLGEISGETCDEEIFNEIFSKFCVGK